MELDGLEVTHMKRLAQCQAYYSNGQGLREFFLNDVMKIK